MPVDILLSVPGRAVARTPARQGLDTFNSYDDFFVGT